MPDPSRLRPTVRSLPNAASRCGRSLLLACLVATPAQPGAGLPSPAAERAALAEAAAAGRWLEASAGYQALAEAQPGDGQLQLELGRSLREVGR